VAPNPVLDVITLTGVDPNSPYEVVEASGRTVQAGRAVGGRVAVHALSPGAYLLRMTGADGVYTTRFVKQ
jgi:hypothetical protein